MMPDWMLENIKYMGNLFDSRRGFTNSTGLNDNEYYNVTWTANPVGGPFPDFNYFAFEGGAPFKMFAPAQTPTNLVVNEYYNFEPVTSFPQGTFDLPAACKKNNSASHAFADEESMYQFFRQEQIGGDNNDHDDGENYNEKLPRVLVERIVERVRAQVAQFKTMALQKQQQN